MLHVWQAFGSSGLTGSGSGCGPGLATTAAPAPSEGPAFSLIHWSNLSLSSCEGRDGTTCDPADGDLAGTGLGGEVAARGSAMGGGRMAEETAAAGLATGRMGDREDVFAGGLSGGLP